MPKADDAKTKLAHKAGNERNLGFSHRARFWQSQNLGLLFSWAAKYKRVLLYIVGVAAALFAVLAPTLFYQPATANLRVDGKTLSLEIAATAAAQEQGLGGRPGMPDNHGMLFTFAQPNEQCFWMKDMRFPLDIIWLNSAKQVVYMQANLSPGTYPEKFCPSSPARYVIELNAGQAAQLGIRSGQTLQL